MGVGWLLRLAGVQGTCELIFFGGGGGGLVVDRRAGSVNRLNFEMAVLH